MDKQIPVGPEALADTEDQGSLEQILPDLAYKRLFLVNVAFVGRAGAGDREWTLVDAGIHGSAGAIANAAKERFGGRSDSFVMRPNWPIASRATPSLSPTSSEPFQNPNVQCALNDANPQSMPSYMKCGMLHFIVSSTSGQAWWMICRRCSRIGRAKSAESAMYVSMRSSRVPMSRADSW